jgi:hypothetical protein
MSDTYLDSPVEWGLENVIWKKKLELLYVCIKWSNLVGPFRIRARSSWVVEWLDIECLVPAKVDPFEHWTSLKLNTYNGDPRSKYNQKHTISGGFQFRFSNGYSHFRRPSCF